MWPTNPSHGPEKRVPHTHIVNTISSWTFTSRPSLLLVVFREMISTPLIVFTKQSLWLANYRDKKGIYIKKYKRKDLMWSRQNRGDFAPKTHGLVRNLHMHGWLCEIRTCLGCCAKFALAWAVVFRRPYLPHFSSKSYTVWRVGFLVSWALKWYIACRKWNSESAPKVRRKTAATVLCSLHSVFLFASLLYLACLIDPKSFQNTKTSHKYD